MNIAKKKLTIGILAHVDAGKTTLSEALLFLSGKIRSLGRVDHKNTYLDTNPVERERGITVFQSKRDFQRKIATLYCSTLRGTSIFQPRPSARSRSSTMQYS